MVELRSEKKGHEKFKEYIYEKENRYSGSFVGR